jgi:hypothetical protein
MPHTIRLRGPWEYQPLARYVPLASGALGPTNNDLPPGGAMELPADWGEALSPEFQGEVRFVRRFNRPTGLDTASRVWLVIEDVDFHASVVLNGRDLGGVLASGAQNTADLPRCPVRFDITPDLALQNVLSITVKCPQLGPMGAPLPRPGRTARPGGLIGLVRLEIEQQIQTARPPPSAR